MSNISVQPGNEARVTVTQNIRPIVIRRPGVQGTKGDTGPAGVGDKYDLAVFVKGLAWDGEEIIRHVFAATDVSFPDDFDGSQAVAGAVADDAAIFTIEKNGVQFGTLTFAQGSNTGTFSATAETFTAADVLTVNAPSPADSTLANISITLTGSR